MSRSFGTVPQPWSWAINVLLLAQFALLHSLFLTRRGRSVIERLAPRGTGRTLATTTFATIASVQLLALFVFWTPSGIIWWEATGSVLWLMGCLYAFSWLLLIKASWDAGAEVQSGLLGWMSLLRGVKPQFPPMPTKGLFKVVRQPIYVAFALTTWCVPIWTPDQLLVAIVLTAYCLLGPLAKEKRFAQGFGQEWQRYRDAHPYWLPRPFALFGSASMSAVDPRHLTERSNNKTRLGMNVRAPKKPIPRKTTSA
ncbi:MAG: isoprenylcysteine carboxylmethyltransferase family protein [Pseudomonadota bacterium]